MKSCILCAEWTRQYIHRAWCSIIDHDFQPYHKAQPQWYNLSLWRWPERSTAHVRHSKSHHLRAAFNQNALTYCAWPPFFSTILILISDFVTTASINIVILLQYVRHPLMHWHRLATRGRYQLCKVRALYNSSAHAHKFCHWSCSVISWSEPRFQERRTLLLVDTKHSSAGPLSDWLKHKITFSFLDSYWSTLYSMCLCSAAHCIVLQGKANKIEEGTHVHGTLHEKDGSENVYNAESSRFITPSVG